MALIWKKQAGRDAHGLRRSALPPPACGPGMAGVGALVIGAPHGHRPGELYRQGMAGMGAGIIDQLTGGAATQIQAQLGRVETALKISTGAAIASALLSLYLARRR